MTSSELLVLSADQWKRCESHANPAILRLSILRDLSAEFHALRSQVLASGNRDELPSIEKLQARIDRLKSGNGLTSDLSESLALAEADKTQTLPPARDLQALFPGWKLDRLDRSWEASLALQAHAAGWDFWRLDAFVQITAVEQWHASLKRTLWPDGVQLFVEAAHPSQSPDPLLWHGRWILTARPGFRRELPFHSWPGAAPAAGPQPRWEQLFPSRPT